MTIIDRGSIEKIIDLRNELESISEDLEQKWVDINGIIGEFDRLISDSQDTLQNTGDKS